MTISNTSIDLTDFSDIADNAQPSKTREVTIWLTLLDVLVILSMLFTINVTEVIWYVDVFVVISLFIHGVTLLAVIPGKK